MKARVDLTTGSELDAIRERVGEDLPQAKSIAKHRSLVETTDILHEVKVLAMSMDGEEASIGNGLLELERRLLDGKLADFNLADVLCTRRISSSPPTRPKGKHDSPEPCRQGRASSRPSASPCRPASDARR